MSYKVAEINLKSNVRENNRKKMNNNYQKILKQSENLNVTLCKLIFI